MDRSDEWLDPILHVLEGSFEPGADDVGMRRH